MLERAIAPLDPCLSFSPLCASVVLAAGLISLPASAFAAETVSLQSPADTPPTATDATAVQPPPQTPAASTTDIRVRFNFKGQTYDQILDWFSRMTGYPIVREVPVPPGTVDYIYPGEYSIPEAIETLNILLQTQQVMLRVEGERLFLQKLDDMKRENVPTFIGTIPDSVTNDTIVTVVVPLLNARATPIAEQLRNLVAAYGSITPLEQQNSIVIVETAAQVRRLQTIIAEIDQQDVENIVDFIPLQHAKAAPMLKSLTALMGERIIEYVINPADGKRQKIEENRVAGLMLASDDRTNAIVARGSRAKIEQVRETIALLDVPADDVPSGPARAGGQRAVRTIRTFALERQTAATARGKLEELFSKLPADRRPTIVPFEESNRIALAGDPAVVAEGEQILRELEGTGATQFDLRETRFLPVRNASAKELVVSIGELGRDVLRWSDDEAPSIRAIAELNGLLVNATPRQHEAIAAILAGVDVERGAATPLRILQLRTADAVTLAQSVTQNYARRSAEERLSKPLTVTADASTNTLLVAGHPDVFEEIKGLVDQLNDSDQTQRAAADGREIRIFPLKVAQATELARTIDEMYPAPPAPVDPRGRPRPELAKPREVVVRADVQTNSLIVDAPIARMAGFQQLVDQLDRTQISTDTEVRTWRFARSRVETIANTLRQLASQNQLGAPQGKGQTVVNVEPISGTLIVSGPKEVFAKVDEVLEGLGDSEIPPTTLKTYTLTGSKAETLAPMLRQVLAGRMRQDWPDAATEIDQLLDVMPVPRSNAIILSAPQSLIPLADELVQQLDRLHAGGHPGGDPTVRVLPLTFADAGAVANSLMQTLPTVTSSVTGDPMNVRVVAAGGANALLLVGIAADLDEVEALIAPLDARPASDSVDAKSYALKFGQATAVAPTLERLLNDQQETDPRVLIERMRRSRGQVDVAPKVRVEAEPRTNSIIVSGPQRLVALAETLLEQLDRADSSADRVYATFTPSNARLGSLVETARRVLDATKPAGVRATLELVPEPQSGSVVVVGTEEETDRALELLTRFDASAIAPPQVDLAVVTLKHIDASTAAQTVTPVLLDRTRWPAELAAAAQAGIAVAEPRVVADVAANRVLISAPKQLVPMAQELIGRLDLPREAGASTDIRVYTLVSAEANEVARALTTAAEGMAKARPNEARATIVAENSSNAIVVTATAGQLAEFDEVVRKLDTGTRADAVQVRSVFLKNGRAEQVAPMVEKLLAPVQQPPLPSGRPRPQPSPTEPPVRVVADTRLNAVVISATSATLNVAEQMVAQLDQQSPSGAQSVRVLTVENADAAELARNIEDVFRDAGSAEVPPTVRVNSSGNALIVRASDEQFEAIEAIVSELDQATVVTSRQLRTLPIDASKASAREIAEILERLLRDRQGSTVEVVPVEDLMRKYAAPAGKAQSSALPGAAPQAVFVAWAATAAVFALPDDQPTGDEPDLTIAVDERTNSLILLGSPKAIERARRLAEQAQLELPSEGTSIRAVTVPDGMDIERIRSLVSETLNRMTPAGGKAGDLARRVALLADPAARTIIVAATDRDFEIVGQLIATFAKSATPDRLTVKSYALANVSADRAARGLRELLQAGAERRRDSRFRDLSVTLDAGGTPVEATFDPSQVRVVADPARNSIVVFAPGDAVAFVDRFVELADQSQPSAANALRLIPLKHAKAPELVGTIGNVFRSRAAGLGTIAPELSADARTNTLVVNATADALREIESLVATLDAATERDQRPLTILDLDVADPQTAAELLQRVVVGENQERRDSTLILPDAGSGTLLVRADEATMAEIRTILRELDRPATTAFKVRSIVLERADAASVAQAIQRLYDDRARIASGGRARRDATRQVSIVGDSRSSTLLISAGDADFDEIKTLVAQFDSAKATQSLEFRVYQLEHARAEEIVGTVQSMLGTIFWTEMTRGFSRGGTREDRTSLAVRADPRMNALIVTGRGEAFALVDQVVEQLDRPIGDGEGLLVRAYPVRSGELDVMSGFIRDALGVREARPGDDGPRTRVVPVAATRSIVVSATERDHAQIAELLASVDQAVTGPAQSMQVIPVEFAQAHDLARTLQQFLADRPGETRGAVPTILASGSANALIVSASADDMATIRDLLAKLDSPTSAGERDVEIIAIERGQAAEIARMVGEQFGRRSGIGSGVIVTPDARTNSLVVNAPPEQLEQVKALVARLDGPSAADETVIRTYTLSSARAEDVARLLGQTLQLDAKGRTQGIAVRIDDDSPPVQVVARIAADRRSNALVVTATSESLPVIEELITKLDDVPAASPVEYRIIPLSHVIASDVATTLRRLVRERPVGDGPNDVPPSIDANRLENQLIVGATADQFKTIESILKTIDVPSSRPRVTDFVVLKHAEAEKVQDALSYFYGRWAAEADTPDKQNARIVADTATNSLVISAAESEWAGIRTLLEKLDSEEYAAGLQLRVLPLMHADARSVAAAINEAFRGPERVRRASQAPRNDEDRGPTTLIRDEDWVSAAAEEGTNAVVVSGNRANLERIEAIVRQLDVADFDRLPAPRLIPVRFGNPEELAGAIDRIYAPGVSATRDQQRSRLRIVADASSNALIVRAPEDEYRHILAIAEALQQQASEQGLGVHLVSLKQASAVRVASAIREAFATRATQAKLPLSVQVDNGSNSLVIASTRPMFDEIKAIVERMDSLAPGAGQTILVIDLAHVAPEDAKRVIEQIGLDKPIPENATSRVVVEPIRVSVAPGRAAIIVIANPADRDTVISLVKTIDSEPAMAESTVRIIPLKIAKAPALARVLAEVLQPGAAPAASGLAKALQEQVRRLSVRRDGAAEPDLKLDLTKPVKVLADDGTNSLVIASTADNVRALEDVVRMLDSLPVTDSVAVQVFPLENIAAAQFARVVTDLFRQGKELGQVPGADLQGVPAGTSGRALMTEIALTTDERTNTVVVAGTEDAIAFVEVMRRRLDTEVGMGWVEPSIIPLRWADAEELAKTIQTIVVEGSTALPEATPLQKQVGRLRMARMDENGGKVLESDVFVPMAQLVVKAEAQLNALVVVGSRANVDIVRELVHQLDVEAASPAALVRVYPLQNASAARLATTITQLFEAQRAARSIRDEDRLRALADERTNALIVSTSPRSFVVFEELLKTLDQEVAPEIKEIRTLTLANASAVRLAPMIQRLMDARLDRLRKVQPETADLERCSIVADGRTNALVVAAGTDTFSVIERLARDLDQPETAETGLLQVIAVRKANIDRVATALNQIMERRYADLPNELERRVRPLVLTDPRTSSLLVSAGPDDLKAIEDLVAKLEATPSNPAVGVVVIPIETARAEELAPRIQSLMRERLQSLGVQQQPSDAVAVTADATSNSLIVAASDENVVVVQNLVEVLTKAAAESIGGQRFEIVHLAKSRPAEIVSMLDEMYVREENRRRGANTVKAAPENRLNAVLISGAEPDVQALRRMIAQLDGAKPSSVVEIKYIPLASANVLETVNLIQTVLSGASIAGGSNAQQAIVLKYLQQIAAPGGTGPGTGPDGEPIEMEVSAAVRQSINLTPDVRTNTVIVRAPRESMGLIERMIKDLDGTSAGAQNIRIFRLVNADADQMADTLTELFSLERRGNLYVLKPREATADGQVTVTPGDASAVPPAASGSIGLFGSDLTLVPDERQQLSITVDRRTNSLLVSGTPNYLDLVEKVVVELDAQEANARDTYVYRLKNATATEVARVLTEFVQQDQQKILATLSSDQRPSAQKLLEQEVTIVGDEKSNSVLVNASPRYMERVRSVLAELDVDPPQVLIQVLLAEITLDSSEDLGLEFARFSIGDVNVAGGFGLARSNFASSSPNVPGLIGLAPALFGAASVPNIAIGNADFDLLINALASQSRVELLSNPSVMVANNTPGRIQVGDTVRLPTSVSFNSAGQQSSVVPEEVGVILNVTPSINPDGFVRMKIEPEISRISKETTQISEDFQSPIINRRRATTTVTVKDGQTVVIGGLIQDRFERIERKIPLLGDIPLLGLLFRNKSESGSKTELLIVLTPHVVTTPEKMDELSRKELDKASLPSDLMEQIRRGELEGVRGEIDEDGRLVDPRKTPKDDGSAADPAAPNQ